MLHGSTDALISFGNEQKVSPCTCARIRVPSKEGRQDEERERASGRWAPAAASHWLAETRSRAPRSAVGGSTIVQAPLPCSPSTGWMACASDVPGSAADCGAVDVLIWALWCAVRHGRVIRDGGGSVGMGCSLSALHGVHAVPSLVISSIES
jgi:hypothetical protein